MNRFDQLISFQVFHSSREHPPFPASWPYIKSRISHFSVTSSFFFFLFFLFFSPSFSSLRYSFLLNRSSPLLSISSSFCYVYYSSDACLVPTSIYLFNITIESHNVGVENGTLCTGTQFMNRVSFLTMLVILYQTLQAHFRWLKIFYPAFASPGNCASLQSVLYPC